MNGEAVEGDGLADKAVALEGELLGVGEGAPSGDGAAPGAGEGEGFGFDVDPYELAADTLEMLGASFAPYWFSPELPDDVRITRAKVEKLSKGYVQLAMKYLPGMLEKYPLEAAVLIQTVMVVRPLLMQGVPLHKPKPKPQPKPVADEKAPPS